MFNANTIKKKKSIIVLCIGNAFFFCLFLIEYRRIVYEEEYINNFNEVSKLPLATALNVKGRLVLTPEAKQPFEIRAAKVEVEGREYCLSVPMDN